MPNLMKLFKPGRHTDSKGVVRNYTEAELRACAEAYDPELLRAPFVVGHPDMDAPAYGWLKSVSFVDGHLMGEPEDVNPDFAEAVNTGAYPRLSISLYLPDTPGNPAPGNLYPRHVGFLGAAAPAIKGLGTVKFSDAGEGTVSVEFGELDPWPVAQLFRQLRDFLIADRGLEAADNALPGYLIGGLEVAAALPPDPTPAPAYAEPKEEQPLTVSPEQLAQREADLAAREAALTTREAADRKKANADFVESVITQGRVLPVHKEALVAFMETVPAATTVQFAEGTGTATKPSIDWFKGFLASLPTQVTFAEVAGGPAATPAATAEFAQGYAVDTELLEIHQKAVSFQGANNCDYETAVRAVGGR